MYLMGIVQNTKAGDQELGATLKAAGFGNMGITARLASSFGKAEDAIFDFLRRTGRLPEEFIPRPISPVRSGPFYFMGERTDNGALKTDDSLISTIVDPVLLNGGASADDKTKKQCVIMTGFRLEWMVTAAESDTDTTAGVLAQAMVATGLHVKHGAGVTNGVERYFSAAGATCSFFEGSSVEDTNSTTRNRTVHRARSGPVMLDNPVAFLLNGDDTFALFNGTQSNTAANLKCAVHVEGLVLQWDDPNYRPGLDGCNDGIVADLISRRLRARRFPTPLLQLG